jgi:hypothetical protein
VTDTAPAPAPPQAAPEGQNGPLAPVPAQGQPPGPPPGTIEVPLRVRQILTLHLQRAAGEVITAFLDGREAKDAPYAVYIPQILLIPQKEE